MARYSRKEFCELTGVTHAYLSMNIKRGKVILTGNEIDDAVPENKMFLDARRLVSAPAIPEPVAAPKDKKEFSVPDAPRTGNSLVEIKTKAQIAKYKEEITLLQEKRKKLNEEIIPREFVVHLIVALAEGSKGAWMRATESLITQFAAANQMTREETVHWRRELTGIINEAIKDGVTEAKKNLRRLASEYAGKKGRGERDES